MPLMKGIKFACEPCIRGHRSSKCNHSDRVLVQVRKPGRPLSSCPHTLSSSSPGTFVHSVPTGASRESGNDACGVVNCSCDVTSVAIPKIASCACGTSKSHEPPSRPPSLSIAPSLSQSPNTTSHSSMIASPTSPTSPTISSASSLTNGTSSRISKSQRSKKRNGIAGGVSDGSRRRASFIGEEVALELLLEKERESSASAESVKMERVGSCCGGGTGVSNGNGLVSGHMNGHSVQGFVPVFSANIEDQFHQQQQQFSQLNARISVGDTKPAPITNGGSELKMDMDMSDILSMDNWSSGGNQSPSWAQPQSTSKKMGVCCGNKPSQSPHIQQQNQLMQYALPNPQTRPCCSGAGNNGLTKPTVPIQQQSVVPLAPYGVPQYFSPPQYPPPPYLSTANFQLPPPVWSYPVSTINHPLTPQELAWLQQQRAAGVFGQPPLIIPHLAGAQVDSWAHNCNCGSGCDCLGCATHPFNRRTVEYVKGIQQFMEGDHYSHSRHNHSHSRITFPQPLPQTQPQQQDTGFGNGDRISTPTIHPTQPPSTTADAFSNVTASPAPVPTPTTPPATTTSCCNGSHSQEEHDTHQLSPSPSPSQDDENGGGSPGGTDNGGELSPSNFFYVDYPFGTCAQTESGCKCGEGCTCVGCLTHGGHDGVGLEGNLEENAQWGW